MEEKLIDDLLDKLSDELSSKLNPLNYIRVFSCDNIELDGEFSLEDLKMIIYKVEAIKNIAEGKHE